jgi:signal transduction histidine kinase/FixJ family two-component response regulator
VFDKTALKKLFAGPALVLFLAAVMALLSSRGVIVPNPVLFFSLAIVLAAFIGGYASGVLSVVLSFAFVLVYWSRPSHLFSYDNANLTRLLIFVVTMPAMALVVGALERNNRKRIAEIERKTKDLADSQRRLQRAEFVAGTGNWEVDVATGALYASEGARHIYGIGAGPYRIKDVQAIPLPQYRAALDAAWRNITRNGIDYDVVFKILRPTDGAILDIHSKATFDADTRKIFGTIQDITAQKKIEADLVESREKAEAANRAKSAFLANMSHEIRTPLNGVLGMLQALEDTDLSAGQRQSLTAAVSAAKGLTQLLKDILDLSRVESGTLELAVCAFTPESLAASIEGLFLPTARDKGLTLSCRIAPGTPAHLEGDEARIRQILFNLLGNALKFTDAGGVVVSMEPLRREGRTVQLLFTVADTGIGIPDAVMDVLCEPFTQAQDAGKQRPHGVGLGLSIVKKLVRLLDGEMAIESEEGRGTTVYLSLPLRLAETAAPCDQENPQPAPPRRPLTILMAEDDAISAMACRHMLEKMGHTVALAQNGQEAVDLLGRQDFDLVVMDIQMPVLGGLEATQQIRDRGVFGEKAAIPIIAVTAYAMAGDKERFLAAGMDAHVAKPVDKAALSTTIARVMETARQARPAQCHAQEPDA